MNAERHLVTFAVSPAPGRDPAVGDSVAYAGPSSQTVMAAWSRDNAISVLDSSLIAGLAVRAVPDRVDLRAAVRLTGTGDCAADCW